MDSHIDICEQLLEWLQGNPLCDDEQYNVLFLLIFVDNNNMILFSETMKHHHLWDPSKINNICIKSNIDFFKFMFDNHHEFVSKFDTLLLFKSIEHDNYEAVHMMLERYPDIIYKTNIIRYETSENILNVLSRSECFNFDLFQSIAKKNPKAILSDKNTGCPLVVVIYNNYSEDGIDDFIMKCLEYYEDKNDPKYINTIFDIASRCLNLNMQITMFEKLKHDQNLIDKLLIKCIQSYCDASVSESKFVPCTIKTIETLLKDYNADPNNKYKNKNAVEIACSSEEYELLLLLEKFNGNLNNQDLILLCNEHGNGKVVKYLKDNYNLDLNVVVDNGKYTFVQYAFSGNYSYNAKMCEYLIDCDVDFTTINSNGQSFLHLWAKKISIDIYDISNEKYPLISDDENDKMKIIFRLIDHGVNPYLKDNNGDYFFNIKHKFDYYPFIFTYNEYRMLYERGIDLTLKNKKGYNLLDILHNFCNKNNKDNKNNKGNSKRLWYSKYQLLYDLFTNELNMVLSE